MNLHKTIGFLATLLLVLGLGVPDSFAQTVKVSDVSPSSLREGQSRSVTVEVELSAAPGANATTTVTVALPGTFPTGSNLTAFHGPDADDNGVPDTAGFPEIEISGTDTKGTAVATVTATENTDGDAATDTNYNHPRNKVVAFTLTASGAGGFSPADPSGETLTVREDDNAIGPLSLSIDPPGVDADATGGSDVTLTVTLEKAPGQDEADPPQDISVAVTVTATEVDGTTEITGITNVDIGGDDKTGTTTVTVPAGSDAGDVNVVAIAVGYERAEINIPVIERDANDVAGYRVLLTAPGANAWKGIAKKAVTVEVVRADRIAYPWTEFSSIEVSLADTLVNDTATPPNPIAIYTLTASGFNKATGDLTFSRARAENTISPDPAFGKNADANEITYDEGADKLIFKFQTKAVGTTGVLGDIPADHDRNAEDDAGQRTAVYAFVTFNAGGEAVGTLNNRSSAKITTTSNIEVGNGRLIKLDLQVPTAAARDAIFPSVPVVTINGEPAVTGKKGDVIRVAVERSDERPRSEKGQIIIQSLATSDVIESAKTLALKTWTFDTLDLIDHAGDSLVVTIKVEDLAAQNTTSGGAATTRIDKDGNEVKGNVKYEPDNLEMVARVRIRDQALNNSGVVPSEPFRADPRAPVISVLHPTSDAPHFSGRNQNTIDEDAGIDFDDFLKPLELRADETLDSLFVYIKGATYYIEDDERVDMRLNLLDEDAERGVVTKNFVHYTAFGDTTSYDTRGLKWKNAKGEAKATGQGGRTVDLVIEAYDLVGNKTTMTVGGVHHDEVVPTISDFFPNNELLADDDNQINDATRHPVFTLKEDTDSLAIVYDPDGGDDIVKVVADGLPEGEHHEIIADPFTHNRTYTLTIFARDLAGNAFVTDADDAADLRFNEQFDNPVANAYAVTYAEATETTKADSVIAGQINDITIQAYDNKGTADDDEDDRNALTYENAAMISARDMASDGQAGSVRFHGDGVIDKGDGSAMLDVDAWKLGKRTVKVMSQTAIDLTEIRVQNLMDGEGGTTVPTFEGAVDSFYVGAADFAGFKITAHEPDVDGMDVSERGITGDFDLKVVPVDKFGNPSVRAYTGPTGKLAEEDSLAILNTRVEDSGIEYEDGIDVTFVSIPALEELNPLFIFPIPKGGQVFPILLPEGRRSLTVQVKVEDDNLSTDPLDERSGELRPTTKIFNVVTALEPMLTLRGDVNAEGNVEVPADGITVTVAATDYNAGSMVTFTKSGTMLDPVTANDDGEATLDISMTAAGTVTVSATDGDWPSNELTITFVDAPDEPTRVRHWADAEMTDPVYLVYDQDAGPSDYTVDSSDLMALIAVYNQMADANIQADTNDDGVIDEADLRNVLGSWGKTDANAPASKPIVLLPGVNENAEFSLSLGSERVVAGELVAVDVSLANVQAVMGYGFALNYEMDKFEFVSVAPADEDLLTSTGGETLFHHIVADGQIEVATGMYNGTAISGGGDAVRFVFRVLREFEDNARFEIANGLVFDPSQLQNPVVVAGVLELQSTPREFALHQNFPNPFNPDTTIKYDLAESADVTLQIYNVLGQVVRTLVGSEAQNAGRYQIRWNGMDDRGVPVSSGIYFYQISADGKFSDVRKLMLLK